jgi:hypothetical protein
MSRSRRHSRPSSAIHPSCRRRRRSRVHRDDHLTPRDRHGVLIIVTQVTARTAAPTRHPRKSGQTRKVGDDDRVVGAQWV